MNLTEPHKKKNVQLPLDHQPFPLVFNNNKLKVYTAHLNDVGSSIVDPQEIDEVHSMGFFGNASLSRGAPTFDKVRFRAPPVVRQRQFDRRKQWLDEVIELNKETEQGKSDENQETAATVDAEKCSESNEESSDLSNLKRAAKDASVESTSQDEPLEKVQRVSEDVIIEDDQISGSGESSKPNNPIVSSENEQENRVIDEVVLDSTDDDICEVLSAEDEDNLFSDNDETLDHQAQLSEQLLVLPDSDSDTETYLQRVTKPKVENAAFPVRENLHLTFEETFFLSFALGCLRVLNYNEARLTIKDLWDYFNKEDRYFLQKYVVYHYFRSKGWVVKPGLKFGGDFLLYKMGPPFYHASYNVIIQVVDADTLTRDPVKSMRKLSWIDLFGLNRVTENAAKEILIAQVLWPSSVPRDTCPSSPEILSEFTVKEQLLRRWVPRLSRETTICQDDDDSS